MSDFPTPKETGVGSIPPPPPSEDERRWREDPEYRRQVIAHSREVQGLPPAAPEPEKNQD